LLPFEHVVSEISAEHLSCGFFHERPFTVPLIVIPLALVYFFFNAVIKPTFAYSLIFDKVPNVSPSGSLKLAKSVFAVILPLSFVDVSRWVVNHFSKAFFLEIFNLSIVEISVVVRDFSYWGAQPLREDTVKNKPSHID
jgi:hypothetical protein